MKLKLLRICCVVSAQIVTHIVNMPALYHGLDRTPPATARPGAKSPRSALAAKSSAKSPRFALRGGAKRDSSNKVAGGKNRTNKRNSGENIGGKKINKNTTKKKRTSKHISGKHKADSRVHMSRLVYERRHFAMEDDRSRLCNEIGRGSLLVNTLNDKARQQRQDHAAEATKYRDELLEYQAAMPHKCEEHMQMEFAKIVQSELGVPTEVPKFIGCTRGYGKGKLGAASSDLRDASHAVDAVVRHASRLLDMGVSDRHMLMGAALRIVELCLADGSELPEPALAAARLTYRSSSASTWALAVFQTALALGGHGAVGNAAHVVRTIAPDDSVRKSAWHIQCRLVNIWFGSSMCSAI